MSQELSIPPEFASIASVLQLDTQLIGDYGVKVINSRDLHQVLGIGRKFSSWMLYQCKRSNLVEDEDYERAVPTIGNQEICGKTAVTAWLANRVGKDTAIEFRLTVEAAKKIAVLSQTKGGDLVWKYLLHMEKIAQQAYRGELPRQLPEKAGAEESASYQVDYLSRAMSSAMLAGGWSDGYRQKQVYVIAEEVDRRHGTNLKSMLPPISVALPGALEETDPTKGYHAMHKQIGGDVLNTQQIIDQIEGTGITWASLMLRAGYAEEVRSTMRGVKRRSGLKRSAKCPVEWATQSTLAGGLCAGQPDITAWHYDMIPKPVLEQLKKLAREMSAKK
jgi:phage anti-repressor protein